MLLFEDLFILALDEEKGEIVETVTTALERILPGAILAELALGKRIVLVEERLHVVDQTPLENPVLDKALFDIVDTPKPRKVRYWINNLIYQRCGEFAAQELVEKGILVRRKKHLHLALPEDAPEGAPSLKYFLKNRLRAVIFTGQEPDPSERILLAFLYHGDILKLIYTHGERKAAHKHVKKLVEFEEGGLRFDELIDHLIAICCEA